MSEVEILYLLPRDGQPDPISELQDLVLAVDRRRSGYRGHLSIHCPLAREVIRAAEAVADALDDCELGFTTVPSPQTGATTTYCPACGGEGRGHWCATCGRRLDVHWWPRRHWRCPHHGVTGIGEHHEDCGCRLHASELHDD